MTNKVRAIKHLHEILKEYQAAETHFIEVEAKYWASEDSKRLQGEYDKAKEVWFALGDQAFSLAMFITDNAVSEASFERLMNFHIDELINMTA